jgi:hypothetical protein
MKFNSVIICVVLLLLNFIPITAQNEYAIASCDSSPTPRDYIGDKFYLVLPNNRDMLILSFPKKSKFRRVPNAVGNGYSPL